MRGVVVALIALVVLSPSVLAQTPLKTAVTLEDYRSLAESALDIQEIKDLIGTKTLLIQFQVADSKAYVSIANGAVADVIETSSEKPDYTVKMSRDAALSLLNSEDQANTLKLMLNKKAISLRAANPGNQIALKAAIRTGTLAPGPLASSNIYIINSLGAPYGALGSRHALFSTAPASSGIFFNRPPGVLAQNPGLIYDTVTSSPYGVGPHNIFRVNPGLIGPNDILRLNPGLIGPADIALLNPNLHGPAEFAYTMGIGAHSNTAKHLQDRGLVNNPNIGTTNRWGNRR